MRRKKRYFALLFMILLVISDVSNFLNCWKDMACESNVLVLRLMLKKTNYHHLLQDLEKFYCQEEGDNIIVYVGDKKETVIFNSYEGAEILEDILFF